MLALAKSQKQTVCSELAKYSDRWTMEDRRGGDKASGLGEGLKNRAEKFGGTQLPHRMPLHNPAPGATGGSTSTLLSVLTVSWATMQELQGPLLSVSQL